MLASRNLNFAERAMRRATRLALHATRGALQYKRSQKDDVRARARPSAVDDAGGNEPAQLP